MKGSRETKNEAEDADLNEAIESAKFLEGFLGQFTDKVLNQGVLPKDALGVKNNVLEGIYAQAYQLYNTGKYLDAIHLFRMLILIDPTEPKFTMGLAACSHMMKEYTAAAQSYTLVGIMEPHNPIPHYHASDCYLQLKDPVSAMIALEMAISRAGDRPEYQMMKERAQLSLQSLRDTQKKELQK